MANKAKRQPKAGEIAYAKNRPTYIAPARPASEREPTILPVGFKIIRYAANAYRPAASQSWRSKGGMMGGATGACAGTTSRPDVARAFIGTRG